MGWAAVDASCAPWRKQGGYCRLAQVQPRTASGCCRPAAMSGCDYAQRIWEVATGRRRLAYRGHDNTVLPADLQPGRPAWRPRAAGNNRRNSPLEC